MLLRSLHVTIVFLKPNKAYKQQRTNTTILALSSGTQPTCRLPLVGHSCWTRRVWIVVLTVCLLKMWHNGSNVYMNKGYGSYQSFKVQHFVWALVTKGAVGALVCPKEPTFNLSQLQLYHQGLWAPPPSPTLSLPENVGIRPLVPITDKMTHCYKKAFHLFGSDAAEIRNWSLPRTFLL